MQYLIVACQLWIWMEIGKIVIRLRFRILFADTVYYKQFNLYKNEIKASKKSHVSNQGT